MLISMTLLTSANCWRTQILFLHLLFWLFATCIFSLIWVGVYFKHSPPTCLFLPITILSPLIQLNSSLSVIAAGRHLRNTVPTMTRDEDIPPDVKAVVRSCLFCPRPQSEVVYSSCSISASAVEGRLSQRFTHRHCQVTESMLVTVLCVTQLHPRSTKLKFFFCFPLLLIWRFTIFV